MMHRKQQGQLLVLLATLCWSMSGVLMRMTSVSAILVNALRNFIAVFILLACNHWRLRMNRTIWIGGFCGAIMTTFYFLSLRLTTAANAIVIQYTAPIFVLLFTCLREKKLPRAVQVGAVVLASIGVATVFSGGLSNGGLSGNICALISGLAFAGMFFVNRLPQASPLDSSILAFSLCALTGFFYLHELSKISSEEWLIILFMGLVQHGLAYVFFCIGIRCCSSFTASLIGMLETVLVPLWVFLTFGEAPEGRALIGCALILIAVAMNTMQEHLLESKQIIS